MPEDVLPPPSGDATAVAVPRDAGAARRVESSSVVWLLAVTGLLFVVMGWLLPWFVEPFSGGVGSSPQDAIFTVTGVGSLFVYIAGVAMLALIAGVCWDAAAVLLPDSSTPRARRTAGWVTAAVAAVTVVGLPFTIFYLLGMRRPELLQPFRWARIRGLLALAGAVSTLVIWLLIGVGREEPLFGALSGRARTNNAVWITLTGFLICAVAYGLRPRILRRSGLAFTLMAFAVGALFPFIFNPNGGAKDIIGWGAQFAGIYVLLALGLNVVVGFAGLLDLGYAAFFAIGAYTCASLSSTRHGLHLPFILIVFVGAAIAGVFGVILGAPTLRLRGDYLAIVTLGFGEIVPDAANNNLFGQTGGPNGVNADPAHVFGYDFGLLGVNPAPYFWAILGLIALVVLLLRNVERSRLGRAWVAIREDEVAAAATGINTVTTKLLAFAIGAAVSGFAGAFFGAMLGSVTPENFEFQVSVTALSTVVLGGIGNITGVVVGAVLISFVIFWVLPHISEWSTTVAGTTGVGALNNLDLSNYKFCIYGLILIGVMLLRPAGLLPSQARRVELQTGTESEPLAAVRGTS